MSTPLIIAHRGASADAPEHTLAAFERAWCDGADGIETDVHLTADGKVIAIHDATTERTTGVDRVVAKTRYAELRRLDAGSWFPRGGRAFVNQRIPTLAEVLATTPDGGRVLIEVKTGPSAIAPIREVLRRSAVPADAIRIISFSGDAIAESKRLMPEIKACWITAYRPDEASVDAGGAGGWRPTVDTILDTLRNLGADGLDTEANRQAVTPQLAAALRERGHELHCWTVDDPHLADHFASLGVDSITTNRPAAIAAHLRGRR